MASAPVFKVYDSANNYQAACKQPEQAAVLVSFLGDGATIRFGHSVKNIVWVEGHQQDGKDGYACESYDLTAKTIEDRVFNEIHKKQNDLYNGEMRLYPIN